MQNLKEERPPQKLRAWEGDDVSFSMLKLSFNYMIQNIQSKVMEVHSISNSQIVWLTITFFKFFFWLSTSTANVAAQDCLVSYLRNKHSKCFLKSLFSIVPTLQLNMFHNIRHLDLQEKLTAPLKKSRYTITLHAVMDRHDLL